MLPMNYSQKRRAENEVVFKQRNDAIKNIAIKLMAGHDKVDLALQLTCECSDEDCRARISMPISKYENVRMNAREFIIKLGHEHKDIEKVVHHDGYAIVEKFEKPPKTDGKLNSTK